MVRRKLGRTVITALIASALVAPGLTAPAAAAGDPDEPTITFFGGGFGHGIGMSQYGALGRADAKHTYKQILGFYYADTTVESVDGHGDFAEGVSDDVDVLIDTRTSVWVSPPWVDGGPEEGWEISIRADGEEVAAATGPVGLALPAGGSWSAVADGVDLCDGGCGGGDLAVVLTGGTHVVLEQELDGPNVGNPLTVDGGVKVSGAFARGRIVLRPAALGGGCGGGSEFCVIHADLDLQDYVKGIAEIPGSWPRAAQRAQAVAARSYAASAIIRRKGNGKAYDLLASTQDQYYVGYHKELNCGKWCAAVDATDNEVVVHDGEVAETYYSASNGGHTAEPPDVWSSGTTRDYLVATPDPFDGNAANPYRARDYVYTVAQVSRWLNEYHETYPEAGDQLRVGRLRSIDIDAPPSGRVTFATVTLVGTDRTSVIDRTPGDGDLDPYGFRLYNALRQGCIADPTCDDPLRSTNFTITSIISFLDVEYDDYFYVPVQWMTAEELTTGVAPDLFGPDRTNTRAMIATFLWRFAGEPKPEGPHGFTDVVADSFYEDAVTWMVELAMTTGTGDGTTFSPEAPITRSEAATFLWRFAGKPKPSGAARLHRRRRGLVLREGRRMDGGAQHHHRHRRRHHLLPRRAAHPRPDRDVPVASRR